MNIAFAILAHKYPERIVRLVNALNSEDDHFFIHIDRRASPVFDEVKRLLGNDPKVSLIDRRYPCRWGQFSIVEATLSCLQSICNSNRKFDYVCLLSGQDYPIKSLYEIKTFLEENRGPQFIEAFPMMEANKWSNHGGAHQAISRVLHWHVFLRSRHIHIPLARKIPNSLVPYGGSQWWTLTGECVQWMMDYLDAYPAVIDYFKYTFIPDEGFFQTLVCNSPFKDEVEDWSPNYVDWLNPNPLPPRVLTVEDFELLKNSDCWFARKFDSDRSKELLDLIDQMLLERANWTHENSFVSQRFSRHPNSSDVLRSANK